MRSLKSKKLSLGVLAALVIIDWFVGMQALDKSTSGADGSPNARSTSQHLPTLRIVQLPTTLASEKLLNFAGGGNHVMPFQEAQTLPFTVPLQIGLTQLSSRDTEPQTLPITQQDMRSRIVADAEQTSPKLEQKELEPNDIDDPGKVRTAARPSPAKRDSPQADNLIKLLALYSMLHR